ncbi:MAG: signal peptidase I [Bacteroidota bacterium]
MPTTASRLADRRKRRKEKAKARAKPTLKENLWFWAKALTIIILLRAFIFEPYRIPSESMENTLLVRDFLIVSKLHYGARTPATIGIPFTRIYLPGLELPQTRLPGFSEPKRGDVIVFNYPSAEDIERGSISEAVPVERRFPYIKRLMGLPGDTLAVLDKVLHINGEPVPLQPTMKQRWKVTATGGTRPNARQLEEMDILLEIGSDRRQGSVLAEPREYVVVATPEALEPFVARDDVARVEPFALDESWRDELFNANPDHVPPQVIPGEGITVPLNARTLPLYAEVIQRYEGRDLRIDGNRILVDGQPAASYTFGQDYYFAMGDFRDNSVDSRWWGVVPETHLVGKATFTFLSFTQGFPIPRLNRFFRPIP